MNEEFGPYRLLDLLGTGGMGEVWRAHDSDTDRVVALKLLPGGFADDDGYRQRFLREAQIVSTLDDPHVVPIHRYGAVDGRLYVDMRLVEGRDLETLLAEGPLPPARAVAIVEQIARALHAAHRQGLVHRDVKPSNVLVTDDDFAYLIDFGIAQDVNRTSLTGTNTVVGTLAYMAPERIIDGNASRPSCDVYSLTCVLHECLTGTKPFPGDSMEVQVAAHLHASPPRPSFTSPYIPSSFDSVVDRGMAKNHLNRYPTTVDLAGAARSALSTGTSTAYTHPPITYRTPAPPPAPPPNRRNAYVVTGLVVGLTVFLVAVVVVVVVLMS